MHNRVKVTFPDRSVFWWYLSTESSSSHYGQPVLVDENYNPYGPADLPVGTEIFVFTKNILVAEGARAAGYHVIS